MDITPRQKAFLSKIFDLYQLADEPVHYTAIAEKLGISKWTAYDMMKFLEEKGLVISSYNVPGKGKGGGRSSVSFSPTAKSLELMRSLAGDVPEEKEWREVKEKILTNLAKLKGTEIEKAMDELLKRTATQENPLLYCTDMTTALLLILRGFKDKLKGGVPLKAIIEDTPKMSGRFISLAGLTMGISLTSLAAKGKLAKLLGRTKKYEAQVQALDSRRLKLLAVFMDEAAKILLD